MYGAEYRRGFGSRQRGFNLVELMVAMTISLVVMAGVVGAMLSQKRNLDDQAELSTLQDTQRVALRVLAGVIQSAGYFSDPTRQTMETAFPADPPTFTAVGQVIADLGPPADNGIVVRYLSSGGPDDPVMGCDGSNRRNLPPADAPIVSIIALDPATRSLVCATRDGSPPVQLLTGISRFEVRFGMDIDGDGSVDTYSPRGGVGNRWAKVRSVAIRIAFVNPLQGSGQRAELPLYQVINLMRWVGQS